MDVWVFRIVMRDRDPFEFCCEIVRDLSNQIARQSLLCFQEVSGATRRDRTGDLLITKQSPQCK